MERPKRREQSIAWPRAAKPVLPRSTKYLFLVGGREAAYEQKCTTLRACLKKVQNAASDDAALVTSGRKKLIEFLRLNYPLKLLWRTCTTLGVNTRNTAWFRIRDILEKN